MPNLNKRLDVIERAAKQKKGQRIFVFNLAERGEYSEGGEARTQQDIENAMRRGFDVVVFNVVYGDDTADLSARL